MPSRRVHWHWSTFDSLSPGALHAALALRAAAFVVEQHCVFLDPDGYDADGWHLLGWSGAERRDERAGPPQARIPECAARRYSDPLIACLRLLPPGKYAEPSIGRVVTAQTHRRCGLGRAAMLEGMHRARVIYPGRAVRIGAQQHLERFYASLGVAQASAPYDEDGIPHIEMLWRPEAGSTAAPRVAC